MTDRISQAAYRALMQKQTGTGRSLAEIGEAALQAAGERAAEARDGDAKTRPASPEARKRYIVGLDPGVKTGVAIWDRVEGQFRLISTWDFWDTVFALTRSSVFTPYSCSVVVEVAHYAPTYSHLKAEGQNKHTLSKIARNVGQVTREAQLLAEGLRRFGYEVEEVRPQGKAKKAADDVKQFERLTGWTERTSQHARDAARLVYGR